MWGEKRNKERINQAGKIEVRWSVKIYISLWLLCGRWKSVYFREKMNDTGTGTRRTKIFRVREKQGREGWKSKEMDLCVPQEMLCPSLQPQAARGSSRAAVPGRLCCSGSHTPGGKWPGLPGDPRPECPCQRYKQRCRVWTRSRLLPRGCAPSAGTRCPLCPTPAPLCVLWHLRENEPSTAQ